jgi:hypothetical protein
MRHRAALDSRLPRRLSEALARSISISNLSCALSSPLSSGMLSSGMSSLVHRWTLDSASKAQAAVPYLTLKDPSLTQTHIPARMTDSIAYSSSVAKTCVTAQLVAGSKRDRRSWGGLCPIGGIANAVVGLASVFWVSRLISSCMVNGQAKSSESYRYESRLFD